MSVESLREIYANLTEKEWAVARLLATGMTLRDAARALGKSEVTVKVQARTAMVKLGIHGRTFMLSPRLMRDYIELQYGDTDVDLELLRGERT